MSDMINSLFNKQYTPLLDTLDKISGQVNNEKIIKEFISIKRGEKYVIFNPLSHFIFVVSDLNDLTHTIKNEYEELKSVNTGSQKFRGSTSYLNNILSRLDKDFRDSMFNHNLKYYGQKSLRKTKFSYKNIHNNLGYAR
jgi:hypothetical protein